MNYNKENLKARLQVEVEISSDILEKVEVNGEEYFKISEPVEIDDEILDGIQKKIVDDLRWRKHDFDMVGYFKTCIQDFIKENKDEILKQVTNKIFISVLNSKEGKALKD